jgi:hypothetical protein
MNLNYKIETSDVGKHVKHIQEAFAKKRLLQNKIQTLIREFEDETGLAIDAIKYQRDITLPIKGPKYTDLTIVISSENMTD